MRAAAVATLVAATVGGDAVAPAAADDVGKNDAVRSLLSYVPTGHRYHCHAQDPTDPAAYTTEITDDSASISGALSCGPDDTASYIGYWQFTDAAAMDRTFDRFVTGNTASTENCPADGTWGFGDATNGRIGCFLTAAKAAVRVWTDDRTLILAEAALEDGNSDTFELRKWWKDEAGPLEEADDTGLTELDRSRSRALLKRVPERTRDSCSIKDPFDVNPTGFVGPYFIEAFVGCDAPAAGIGSVTYQMTSPDIIEDYLDEAYSPTDAQVDAAADDAVCPVEGNWTVGKGKHKRTRGAYTCYFEQTSTGRHPVWTWTDTHEGILATARSRTGDADVLHDWWASKASGPLRP